MSKNPTVSHRKHRKSEAVKSKTKVETFCEMKILPKKLYSSENNTQIIFQSDKNCQNTNGWTLSVNEKICRIFMVTSVRLKKKHDGKSI